MSQDITFCLYANCDQKNCFRHRANITEPNIPHSFSCFPECPYFVGYQKEIQREFEEEARREAMRLDDNEDTLKWKGTH